MECQDNVTNLIVCAKCATFQNQGNLMARKRSAGATAVGRDGASVMTLLVFFRDLCEVLPHVQSLEDAAAPMAERGWKGGRPAISRNLQKLEARVRPQGERSSWLLVQRSKGHGKVGLTQPGEALLRATKDMLRRYE